MSQYTLLSEVDRGTTYPVSQSVSAPSNCGTLILTISTPFTEQQLYELPAINVRIYTGTDEVRYNFDINLETVNSRVSPVQSVEPYSIPIMDIPSTFKIKCTPIFDDNAITAHNELIQCSVGFYPTTQKGIVTDDTSQFMWGPATTTFPVQVYFDNANIKSGDESGGGGGGGGGSSSAVDVSYNNSISGLMATNVQDAITELAENQTTVTTSEKTVTLYANNWNNGTYQLQDNDIRSDSDVYINVPDGITKEQYDTIAYANIISVGQSNNYVILSALRTVPSIDVPIRLVIRNNS